MNPIKLNKAVPELDEQLAFLIRREFYVTYDKYQQFSFYLLGITIFVIALATLTDADSLIILKGVSIMFTLLIWVGVLVFLSTVLIKWYKREVWKKKVIKEAYSNATEFQLSFDDKKIFFITDTFITEIEWNYYKYYAIDKKSIFIFHEKSIYDSIYYSEHELGIENYKLLETMVSSKLIRLENKRGS